VPDSLKYEELEQTIKRLQVGKLEKMQLFDVFESEKLGSQKKSMAISFQFLDKEKTLTDMEIDAMMNRIILSLDKECQAEIRK
jgi:phenylalanyl-tRNA synthetase beta chain